MWTLSYMISWSVSRYPETSKQRRHTAPTRETMQVSFQYDKTPRRQKKTENHWLCTCLVTRETFYKTMTTGHSNSISPSTPGPSHKFVIVLGHISHRGLSRLRCRSI